MDHLDFIQLLIDQGRRRERARLRHVKSTPTQCRGDSTETRTNFTMQWLYEDGATPFLRAAQSGDVALMKLLLAHGADPKIATAHNVTPLAVASGIGWVEGVTYEWSEAESVEAVKMCLDLGIDPNATATKAAPRCTARRTRAATPSSRCWWMPAPSSINSISAAATPATATCPTAPPHRSLVMCTESFSFSLQMNSIS